MKSSKRYCRATFHLFVYIFDFSGKKSITFHFSIYILFGILCSRHAAVESFEFMGTKICRLWGFLLVGMKFWRCVGFRFQWDELKLFQNFCFCWRCKFLGNYYLQIQQKIEPSWILFIPKLYIPSGKWSITGLRTIFSWRCPPPLKNN